MVSLECAATETDGTTLVTLVVESDEPRRIRVENCLDGPVQPPRERGVPAAGWGEEGFEGVVDGVLGIGYATPAAPGEPAARIVEERPPAAEDGPTAAGLVRERGDGTPPRDAVGAASAPGDSDGTTGGETTPDGAPAAVTAWLDGVETRVAEAEQLGSATSLADATEAVERVGGPDEVKRLDDALAADREALRAMRERCERLADRADAVEIPVETLARLS